eukprot:15792618-Heterocapsa_arctica.AAC.1
MKLQFTPAFPLCVIRIAHRHFSMQLDMPDGLSSCTSSSVDERSNVQMQSDHSTSSAPCRVCPRIIFFPMAGCIS